MNGPVITRTLLLTACILHVSGHVSLGIHPLAQWHQRLLLPTGTPGFVDVTFADGRFVAVGMGMVATSTNGSDWHAFNSGVPGFIQAVAHGNGRFVAVGLNGVAMSSSDGTNWTPQASDPGGSLDLYDLSFGNGLFVATGEAGRIVTSPDGVTWSPQSSGTIFHLYHLAHGRGLFLTPMSSGTNLVSADGTNWLRQASGTANNLYTVGFGGGSFLEVDTRLRVWRSPNATNWFPFGAITGSRPSEIGYGHGQFVILANPAPEYSGQAGRWMESETNILASSVAFGHGTFVITAGRAIFQSQPVVDLEMAAPGAVSLSGPSGNYIIEGYDLPPGGGFWQRLTHLPLTSSPVLWMDAPTNHSGRLYRAVLQP